MRHLPLLFILVLLAGVTDSCKQPSDLKPIDTTHHDSTSCDTCNIHKGLDTTSHDFVWKEMTIPTENNLTGVWVFAPNDIIAVNDVVYRYNGSSWAKWNIPTDAGHNLYGLSG